MLMEKESMKIGIFNWFGYIMPAIERVQMIKEAGFDSIMLWWDEELFSPEGEKSLLEILDMDILIENLHVPYEECNMLWSENKHERDYIIKKHLEWINDCEKYKIPMIVMHVTKGYDVKKPNDHGIEAIKVIVEEARRRNVKIAIENTRIDTFIDVILDEIQSKWLGICYDSSHANLYSNNLTDILEKHGNRVIALHLSDNDKITDRHWIPNEGIIDFDILMSKLAQINYKGHLSFEVFPNKDKETISPEIFLQQVYAQGIILRKKYSCQDY